MADPLLSRLQKVQRRGEGRWIACCPAHADKHPSMTVAEASDGRILIHCFAGCDAGDILGAVGLSFDALFPDKPAFKGEVYSRGPMRVSAADALACVAWECVVVAQSVSEFRQGHALTEADYKRLDVAIKRITEAKELALGD